MTDTQHTLGPWEWSKDTWHGGYSGLYGPGGGDVVVPQCCNDGDDGAAWFDDDILTEANARLIAAAPDLLVALESFAQTGNELLANTNGDCSGNCLCDDNRRELAVEVQAAQVAIAKAKGTP